MGTQWDHLKRKNHKLGTFESQFEFDWERERTVKLNQIFDLEKSRAWRQSNKTKRFRSSRRRQKIKTGIWISETRLVSTTIN